MIARVILNSNTLSTDRLYDYLIPEFLRDIAKVGMRVKVPFGRGNKTKEAYILYVTKTSDYADSLKFITEIINDTVYFSQREVKLIEFMRHRYFCSYISCVRCFIPAGLNMKISYTYSLTDVDFQEIKKFTSRSKVCDKIVSCLNSYGIMNEETIKAEIGTSNVTNALKRLEEKGYIHKTSKTSESVSDSKKTFVELIIDRNEAYSIIDQINVKAPARARVLEVLCENYELELSELLIYAETSKSTVDALYEKGIINYKSVVCNDSFVSYDESYVKPKPQLSEDQNAVFNRISNSLDSEGKHTFMLHGVTGSGKTEVYLSLLEKALKKNKDSILLVPEISLTPQMIGQIYGRFGDNVAVLHSKLTIKQRYTEWNRIKNNEVKIVVGARSAIFAPFNNVGLIIIDEEHETTYKSEMSPRYNAIEIARYLTTQDNSVLVLASATPSVDNYYKSICGSFELLELPNRINKSPLPIVEIADMRQELSNGNMSIFSLKLKEAMDAALKKK